MANVDNELPERKKKGQFSTNTGRDRPSNERRQYPAANNVVSEFAHNHRSDLDHNRGMSSGNHGGTQGYGRGNSQVDQTDYQRESIFPLSLPTSSSRNCFRLLIYHLIMILVMPLASPTNASVCVIRLCSRSLAALAKRRLTRSRDLHYGFKIMLLCSTRPYQVIILY
ncbi:hypothetical protein H5410_015930 [Solanum commersonii]|uniref:Uncharacterized protein n=1 Tax=Solanum commersonii TaxID=4109 RepID=A0A9J5ZVV9_SOLCO|nr:hypothetical protein H5410_015930 [Solanum commersonii]